MRRWLLPLFALIAALAGPDTGQARALRLGVLTPTGVGIGFDAIRLHTVPELATLGFVEGINLDLIYRSAGGELDRLPALARELVQEAPDVIIAIGPPAIRATRQVTRTIPIVMSFAGEDPVAAGWVESLARPGGNVTGLVLLGPELDGKRLEVLHEAVPDRQRIAVLVETGVPMSSLKVMAPIAQALGLELVTANVVDGDYAAAFKAIRDMSAGAVAIPTSPQFFRDVRQIAKLAMEHGLPTVCQWVDMAEEECLIGYGGSLADLRRRTAHYVARIFRGTSPADIPVEQASVFEFAINMRVARALNLTLSPSLLARADVVIE
jgi:putative tryptophan/tyrosine transport system substrate-binding protein